MKIKMLPNWCKKVGFSLFFIGFLVSLTAASVRQSFNDGFNGRTFSTIETNNLEPILFEKWFGDLGVHFFDILVVLGLLIYMMSKEKIEDDYINKLRLESFQLTSFIGLGITMILYVFSKDIKLTLDYFIILFLWMYLITFAIKKRLY